MKKRKRNARRRWVHLSAQNHGLLWTAGRICPVVGNSEPTTPRLCVAANVARCLAARMFTPGQRVYVYRTVARCRALRPGSDAVWDSPLTNERWLIPPVALERVGEVPREVTYRIYMAVADEIRGAGCGRHRTTLRAMHEAIEGLRGYPGSVGAPRWHGLDVRLLRFARGRGMVHGLPAAG